MSEDMVERVARVIRANVSLTTPAESRETARAVIVAMREVDWPEVTPGLVALVQEIDLLKHLRLVRPKQTVEILLSRWVFLAPGLRCLVQGGRPRLHTFPGFGTQP